MQRVGTGFDVHRFAAERRLVLGGVEIPFGGSGLDGHSDADVLCHAIMDALLGAIGEGDIGWLFPNTDPKWKNACSLDMLEQVAGLLKERGFGVVNIDSTVLAEAPKLAPHVHRMRENIAAALEIPTERVSVKATTAEQMGAIGRGEGIAVMAVALLNNSGEAD